MTLSPCLECGEPTHGPRCPEHDIKGTATQRGYDAAWKRLSKRARKLQPFCSDCGRTTDLSADHSEEAWARKAAGKPVRLQDIDVVCMPCNIARGAARGHSARGMAPTRASQPPMARPNLSLTRGAGS